MKIVLGALLVFTTFAAPMWADSDRVITTQGRGVVDMEPDMATIEIGVTQEADEAAEALSLTSAAMQAVITRLENTGIEARDMQTRGLSLNPVWSRQLSGSDAPPEVSGFVARNGLVVRVRDLAALGRILDTVVADGANNFNGLQFSVQDSEAAMAEARADAVRDAVAKAKQLAAAAGVSLGPVLSISEGGGNGPGPVLMEMASARMAADVPVAAGEVSLTAHVNMVFAIQD